MRIIDAFQTGEDKCTLVLEEGGTFYKYIGVVLSAMSNISRAYDSPFGRTAFGRERHLTPPADSETHRLWKEMKEAALEKLYSPSRRSNPLIQPNVFSGFDYSPPSAWPSLEPVRNVVTITFSYDKLEVDQFEPQEEIMEEENED